MAQQSRDQALINNDFYNDLGNLWYTATNHPIALLRAENRIRAPWVLEQTQKHFGKSIDLLDIGCGAGFLSNDLARGGHHVTGIDISESSLKVARAYDTTGKAQYRHANAYDLPYASESFDVACAMDILEHVEDPSKLIREANRVLRPNGLFFFHTFNRNILSRLVVIKGVDWFVQNAPKNLHVYHLFLKPQELSKMCMEHGLRVNQIIGLAPKPYRLAFWKMLFTGQVSPEFEFMFTRSQATGYCGFATKDTR